MCWWNLLAQIILTNRLWSVSIMFCLCRIYDRFYLFFLYSLNIICIICWLWLINKLKHRRKKMLILINISYSSDCLSSEEWSKSPSTEMKCRDKITGTDFPQMLSDSELFAGDLPFLCKCISAVNGTGFVSLLVLLREWWKHTSTSNIMDLAVSSKQLPTHPLCHFLPAQSVIFTLLKL